MLVVPSDLSFVACVLPAPQAPISLEKAFPLKRSLLFLLENVILLASIPSMIFNIIVDHLRNNEQCLALMPLATRLACAH